MRALALVLVFVVVSSAHAQPGGGESVVLKDITVAPEPLYPGTSFNLSFRVVNAWGGERYIGNAYIYLQGGYPFLNISPTQPIALGALGSYGGEVRYTLGVDPEAVEGVYTLKAVISYTRYSDMVGTRGGRERFTEVHPIAIKVSGKPELRVFLSGSEPELPQPGDRVRLELMVANLGRGTARNVLVYAGEGEGVSPEWSGRVVYVGDLEPGGARRVFIPAELSDAPAPEVRTLPVQVRYREGERWLGLNGSVRVELARGEELKLYVDSSSPSKPAPGDTIRLTMRVVNPGIYAAKDVVLELGSVPGVKPVWSSARVYLGDIPPGGSASSVVTLEAAENASAGMHEVPVKLEWRGAQVDKILGLILYRRADFEAEAPQQAVVAGGREQVVSFLVRNTGTGRAEHLRLTLRASYPFTPVGSEYYIPSLAPGESEVAVFHVDVDADAAEQRYPVELVLKWEEDGDQLSGVEYSYIQVLHPGYRRWYYATGALAVLAGALLLRLLRRRR